MILQIEYSKEFQFLAYLVPVLMGIQLSLYFYYQYRKLKDEQLPLNRILLAFGSFILFIVLGPLFIQIARNFIEEEVLYKIVYRIGWGLAFFAPISFSRFIIREDFASIINLNVAKVLMLVNLFPIVLLFILSTLVNPLFIASIFCVVLNGLYILRFQMILIQKSVGKIKRKVMFFCIGGLISMVALVFAILVGLRILPPIVEEIVYFIGIIVLFIGFLVIYFSVSNFPPFYEFEWRDNLLKLFIINHQNFTTFYSLDLVHNSDNNPEIIDQIFSKGISGVEKVISLITDTKGEKINKIQRDEYLIIFEHGLNPSSLIYILIVKKDLISSTHLVKRVRKQFESFFRELLKNLDILNGTLEKYFSSFDKEMDVILQKG